MNCQTFIGSNKSWLMIRLLKFVEMRGAMHRTPFWQETKNSELSHPDHYSEWALNRSKPLRDILIRLQPQGRDISEVFATPMSRAHSLWHCWFSFPGMTTGGSRLSSTTTAAVSSQPATSATTWSQPSSTRPSWQDCK